METKSNATVRAKTYKQVSKKSERTVFDTSALPLWQIARELSGRIPNAELDKIPVDASANLHHYLYGAPRVED